MPTSPLSATATTRSSSATGEKSSRRALSWVAVASIGHNTTHPTATNVASAVAMPASTASDVSVRTARATPITTPTPAAPASRASAEGGSRVLARAANSVDGRVAG